MYSLIVVTEEPQEMLNLLIDKSSVHISEVKSFLIEENTNIYKVSFNFNLSDALTEIGKGMEFVRIGQYLHKRKIEVL